MPRMKMPAKTPIDDDADGEGCDGAAAIRIKVEKKYRESAYRHIHIGQAFINRAS